MEEVVRVGEHQLGVTVFPEGAGDGQALPGAATDFAGATELFEVAWYGRSATGPQEAAHLRDLSDRVLQRARP